MVRLADEIQAKIDEMDKRYNELVTMQQTLMADSVPDRPGQ